MNEITGWDELVEQFPENFEEIAQKHNVMKGSRQDKDLLNTLRVLMIHLGLGYSLKESALRAKKEGLCSMSSVALFKRLRKFGSFFQEMCSKIMQDNKLLISDSERQIRFIDATRITEPGIRGSTWRYHYSFTMSAMVCDFAKLTADKGAGVGESLTHFPINQGDVLVADRGYSNLRGISYAVDAGADVCIRLNSRMLPLYSPDDSRLDLESYLSNRKKMKEGEIIEIECHILHPKTKKPIPSRVCVIRKDQKSIEKSLSKMKRAQAKNGTKTPLCPKLTYLNQYVLIFTTLSKEQYSTKYVLNLYRHRWQVELVFKRFKSLLKLGALAKTTGDSSQAWLYGKLFIAFLIEKISATFGAFSPWRDSEDYSCEQPVAYIRFCHACYPAVDFADVHFEQIKARF